MCLSSFSKTSVKIQKLGLLLNIDTLSMLMAIEVSLKHSMFTYVFLLFPILNTKLNPEIIFYSLAQSVNKLCSFLTPRIYSGSFSHSHHYKLSTCSELTSSRTFTSPHVTFYRRKNRLHIHTQSKSRKAFEVVVF